MEIILVQMGDGTDDVRVLHVDDGKFLLTASRDVAVDAVEAGVTDYVRKRVGSAQYTLLADRVRNAVDRADAERALEACGEGGGERESTGSDASPADWYRSVVETMQEGVYVIDDDHEFRFFDHWVGEAEPGSAADWTGRRRRGRTATHADASRRRTGRARDDPGRERPDRARDTAPADDRALPDAHHNFSNGGVFTFDEDLTYTLAGGEELEAVGLTAVV